MDFSWIVFAIVALYLFNSVKILMEYERGVVFRLGRLLPQAKGPGMILVFAPIDRIERISLRVETMDVPPQDVVTGFLSPDERHAIEAMRPFTQSPFPAPPGLERAGLHLAQAV